MIPKKPVLKFSDKEFTGTVPENGDPGNSLVNQEKLAAFISLFGTSNWNKLRKQFAAQRIPAANPGGFTDQEIKEMSDSEWAENEAKIMADLATLDKNKPAIGEIEAPDLTVKGLQAQQMFIKHFGHERFFTAMGISDYDLTNENYRKILGRKDGVYTTRITWQKGKKAIRS